MSTITAILEPDADGSLHLPLPAEMRHGKVKIVATLSPAVETPPPLEVLREVRQRPLHSAEEIAGIMAQNRRQRADGWSRADDA